MNYVGDYYGLITQPDITSWHESFFWPLPVDYTTRLSIETEQIYRECIDELSSDFHKDTLIVAHRLHTFYSTLLFHMKLVQGLAAYDVVCSDKCLYLGSALGRRPIEMDGFDQAVLERRDTPRVFLRLVRLKIEELLYNAARRRCRGGGTHPRLPVYSFARRITLNRPYVRALDAYVHLLDVVHCLPSHTQTANPMRVDDICDLLVPRVRQLAGSEGIDWRPVVNTQVSRVTRDHLIVCARMLHAMLSAFSKKPRIHLLAPPAGSQLIRAASIAARSNGGEVTGHNHGHTPLPTLMHHWPLFDLSTVDRYVTYTNTAATHMEQIQRQYTPAKNNEAEIISENTPLFRDLWKQHAKPTLPHRIETLMVVDHTISPDKVCRYFVPDLVYVHLLLQIIPFARNLGIHVIYKRHPDIARKRGRDNFFSAYCEEVFTPFEKVMHRTDAYLFFSVQSSIFHHAVCTNKPIIYLDSGIEPFFKESRRGLSKRCSFIRVHFDEKNRPQFDQDGLIEALRAEVRAPDTEYLETHLLPR